MAIKYYKFLNGLQACHGGDYTYELGVWTPEIEDIEQCKSGYHICKSDQLLEWLASDLYECEAEGVVELRDKCVAKRIKLIQRLDTWNEKTIRLFAVWCARQVQHKMKDERSIAALDVAERYANGEATDEELAEAASAASFAAWSAWSAWSAARAARAAEAAVEAVGATGTVGAVGAAEAARAIRAEKAAAEARTKQSAKLKKMLGIN